MIVPGESENITERFVTALDESILFFGEYNFIVLVTVLPPGTDQAQTTKNIDVNGDGTQSAVNHASQAHHAIVLETYLGSHSCVAMN